MTADTGNGHAEPDIEVTDIDRALLVLRLQLYAAAQRLEGDQLAQLKTLIREISQVLGLDSGAPRADGLETSLRAVLALVSRIGGYMTADDQATLWRACQALEGV